MDKKVVEDCTCEMGKGVPHVHMELEAGYAKGGPMWDEHKRRYSAPNAKINNATQSNYHGGPVE